MWSGQEPIEPSSKRSGANSIHPGPWKRAVGCQPFSGDATTPSARSGATPPPRALTDDRLGTGSHFSFGSLHWPSLHGSVGMSTAAGKFDGRFFSDVGRNPRGLEPVWQAALGLLVKIHGFESVVCSLHRYDVDSWEPLRCQVFVMLWFAALSLGPCTT